VFSERLVNLANKRVLASGIGIAAGVMLYVSFIEIFQKSLLAFTDQGFESHDAYFCATVCFFAGCILMKLVGVLVHMIDKDHECHGCNGAHTQSADTEQAPVADEKDTSKKLKRMGLNTALAIAIHNFPEGLATFVGTLADPHVGATLAVAIAIHNIPEGFCVALPIYYAHKNRTQAFLWGLLSGLSEPIGAAVGYAIVKSSGDDMNQLVYGALFGMVGGMMVAIVCLELLPTAHRYDPDDTVVNYSVFAGMVIMALSLVLFMY